MGFKSDTYFWGTPKLFLCNNPSFNESVVKQKYIDFVTNSPDFDPGFKEFIKDPNNIKVEYTWEYYVVAECRLTYNVKYKYAYYHTTGYHAKVEGNNVDVRERTEREVYEGSLNLDVRDYILETHGFKKIGGYRFRGYKPYERFARECNDVPRGIDITKEELKSNEFILNIYKNSDSRSADEYVKNYIKNNGDKYLSHSLESCSVNNMKVYFVKAYRTSVLYNGKTYTSKYILQADDKPDFSEAGKMSEAYLREKRRREQEAAERRWAREEKRKFRITILIFSIIHILFGIIVLVKSNESLGGGRKLETIPFFSIPAAVFKPGIIIVFAFLLLYGLINAALITPSNYRKKRKVAYIIFSSLFIAFLLACYFLIYTVLPYTLAEGFYNFLDKLEIAIMIGFWVVVIVGAAIKWFMDHSW